METWVLNMLEQCLRSHQTRLAHYILNQSIPVELPDAGYEGCDRHVLGGYSLDRQCIVMIMKSAKGFPKDQGQPSPESKHREDEKCKGIKDYIAVPEWQPNPSIYHKF